MATIRIVHADDGFCDEGCELFDYEFMTCSLSWNMRGTNTPDPAKCPGPGEYELVKKEKE